MVGIGCDCGMRIEAEDKWAGSQHTCQKCGMSLVFPARGTAVKYDRRGKPVRVYTDIFGSDVGLFTATDNMISDDVFDKLAAC